MAILGVLKLLDDEDLLSFPLVEDDGHVGHLAPRPRRRRDDDVRRLRPGEELDPLEVLEAAPFGQEDADPLARVDDAPAPHADDAVGPLLAGIGRSAVDDADAGILGNVAENSDALLSQRLHDAVDQPRLHHPRIGHDERPVATEAGHLYLDVAGGPGAEDDFRRTEIDERQIPIVCHGCRLPVSRNRRVPLTPRPARRSRFHKGDRSPCSRS